MKPSKVFENLPKDFWANIRSISQINGYAKKGKIIIPSIDDIKLVFGELKLSCHHLVDKHDALTPQGTQVLNYFKYRADILNDYVEPRLMDSDDAKKIFNKLKKQHRPKCPIPMNKQKGKMKAPSYFTGIINTLIEANSSGHECDYNPRELTTITRDEKPLRTLARWVDGAFPASVNPVAIWEIKEYYYTTTFGSRVADGVYESLLDGMELEELHEHEGIKVLHYLMVDSHYTWWECGKSYLCRLIDILHMGYVDEILFGNEVLERLPAIVPEWVNLTKKPKLIE